MTRAHQGGRNIRVGVCINRDITRAREREREREIHRKGETAKD